ncbi:type 2 isopentenyl-diphosphate Delta-isomerase [Salinibius halmophilus]|uniref:type 2 isopentenyl-diphosphate Delta-isomerase n=1 Tax=Salinibius halmophilus TaxID=1853216 RepID=UPI000E66BEE7|nr:type 2 isopentenyl-diphosphate Delta-isomerase [Salinibius halmophilus]
MINERKVEHIRLIEQDAQIERQGGGFERVRLNHRALPELDFDAIDLSSELLGYSLSAPLLISSMTGGDHALIGKINRNLAEAANECGIAMAVGSQRVMIKHEGAAESFRLRQYAPDVPLIANVGAVQLNYGFGLEEVRRCVDTLQADALYLHLNPLQEAIQPEGDRNFSGLIDKIANLVAQLDIPVFAKEVGCGLNPQDIESLTSIGVKHIDVAGQGGTSWSRIEHHRAQSAGSNNDLGIVFQDWGHDTVDSLLYAQAFADRAHIIASGGIRSPIDVCKALVLGAQTVGMAAPFLKPAMVSTDAVVTEIKRYKQGLQTAMFLLGCPSVQSLIGNNKYLTQTRLQ